jgi:hypothetical protein
MDMSMSPEEKLKSALLKVPVLKTAILKFKFKKLLERLKKGDESGIERIFNEIIYIIIDAYENEDNRLIGKNAEKFELLQTILLLIIFAGSCDNRREIAELALFILFKKKSYFVGIQAELCQFLRDIIACVKEIKVFKKIGLKKYIVKGDGSLGSATVSPSDFDDLRRSLPKVTIAANVDKKSNIPDKQLSSSKTDEPPSEKQANDEINEESN